MPQSSTLNETQFAERKQEARNLLKKATTLDKNSEEYKHLKKQFKEHYSNAFLVSNTEECKWINTYIIVELIRDNNIPINLIEIAIDFTDNLDLAKNTQGENCLHLAMKRQRLGRNDTNTTAIVTALINKQPELIHESNKNGETPLWYAVERGLIPVVKLSLDAGAKAKQSNNSGRPIESICPASARIAIMDLLNNKAKAQEVEEKQLHQTKDQPHFFFHDPQKAYYTFYKALRIVYEEAKKSQKEIPDEITTFINNHQNPSIENAAPELPKKINRFLYDNANIVFSKMAQTHQENRCHRKKFIDDFRQLINRAETIDDLNKLFIELENHSGRFKYLRDENTYLNKWRKFVENDSTCDDTGTTNKIHEYLKEHAAKVMKTQNDVSKKYDTYKKIFAKRRASAFTFLAETFGVKTTHEKLLEKELQRAQKTVNVPRCA